MSTPAPSPSPSAPDHSADTGGTIGGLSTDLIEANRPGFLDGYNRWLSSFVSDDTNALMQLLTFAGVVMLVFSIVKVVSAGRRNSNSYGKAVKDNLGMVVFTTLLLAPGVVLPLVINIVDWAGGLLIAVAGLFAGGAAH